MSFEKETRVSAGIVGSAVVVVVCVVEVDADVELEVAVTLVPVVVVEVESVLFFCASFTRLSSTQEITSAHAHPVIRIKLNDCLITMLVND